MIEPLELSTTGSTLTSLLKGAGDEIKPGSIVCEIVEEELKREMKEKLIENMKSVPKPKHKFYA